MEKLHKLIFLIFIKRAKFLNQMKRPLFNKPMLLSFFLLKFMVMIEIEEIIKRLFESFDDVIDDSSDEKLVDCCVRSFDEVKYEMKNQSSVED